ncbi:MAG: FliM/FliN family flagellar motor switch protein [Pseudomonadota bacterium]
MPEKILTDGEMDALMEGMADGSVAVLRDGKTTVGAVTPFEIRPHCHLSFGTLPELQRFNEAFAKNVQRYLQQTLAWTASCDLKRQYDCTVVDLNHAFAGLQHIMGFSATPLDGLIGFIPDTTLMQGLVEVFFGSTEIPAPDPSIDEYNVGQKRVAQRFGASVLEILQDAWASVAAFSPDFADSWSNVERAPFGSAKDRVIVCEYQVVADGFAAVFSIVLRREALAPHLDRLDGAERPGTEQQNLYWRETLSQHATDLPVRISLVNAARPVSLAMLRQLTPGSQLPIAAPNPVELRCGELPLYRAQFGIWDRRRVARVNSAVNPEPNEALEHV